MIKVEMKLRKIVPNVFSLMYDGCSTVQTHCLALLAFWLCSQASNGYSYELLSFTTLPEEANLSAASQKDTLEEVPQFYEKKILKRCVHNS